MHNKLSRVLGQIQLMDQFQQVEMEVTASHGSAEHQPQHLDQQQELIPIECIIQAY